MAVDFDLSTYLKTRSVVSGIVGTRIYEGRAPQTTGTSKVQPHITYRLLPGSTRHYHSTGASGLVQADIQLMFTDGTAVQARTLHEAVRNEIDGFSGTWGSTTIKSCFLGTPYNASGDPMQGDDTGYPTVGAVAEVTYTEAVPVPVP